MFNLFLNLVGARTVGNFIGWLLIDTAREIRLP
jgi:hypothetical protein